MSSLKPFPFLSRDKDLFESDMSPIEYDYFQIHTKAFKSMWNQKTEADKVAFVDEFFKYAHNFGYIRDFPAKMEIPRFFDNARRILIENFATGKMATARNLVVEIATIAENRERIVHFGSQTKTKDPFFNEQTRETFRKYFGAPTDMEVFQKTIATLPLYSKFGGAVCRVLRRWVEGCALPIEDVLMESPENRRINVTHHFQTPETCDGSDCDAEEARDEWVMVQQVCRVNEQGATDHFDLERTLTIENKAIVKSETVFKTIKPTRLSGDDLDNLPSGLYRCQVGGARDIDKMSFEDFCKRDNENLSSLSFENLCRVTGSDTDGLTYEDPIKLESKKVKANTSDKAKKLKAKINTDSVPKKSTNVKSEPKNTKHLKTRSSIEAEVGTGTQIASEQKNERKQIGSKDTSHDLPVKKNSTKNLPKQHGVGMCGSDQKEAKEKKSSSEERRNEPTQESCKKTRKCHHCGHCAEREAKPATYKKCSLCSGKNTRFYCSKECQTEDWVSRHRVEHINRDNSSNHGQ